MEAQEGLIGQLLNGLGRHQGHRLLGLPVANLFAFVYGLGAGKAGGVA
jgi:hypothetical protein